MPNLILKKHAAFVVFVLISLIVFWRMLSTLILYSFNHESCSHIVLIPFVSLYLLYSERARIFASIRISIMPALVLIFIGAALYWFAAGRASSQGGNNSLSAAVLSLVLIWVGGFLLCYGSQAARAAAFPLLFLLLMIPLPEQMLAGTIHLLQQGSTEIAYLLFKATGVPVLRQGFLLTVPGITIEIARECSGIRSSIALFITCLLAAHMFLRTFWKQALFAILAFPLAIIKNGIRIATLTLLSIHVDPSFLTGRLHHEGGFAFFLLALAIMAPVLFLLQRSEHQSAIPARAVS